MEHARAEHDGAAALNIVQSKIDRLPATKKANLYRILKSQGFKLQKNNESGIQFCISPESVGIIENVLNKLLPPSSNSISAKQPQQQPQQPVSVSTSSPIDSTSPTSSIASSSTSSSTIPLPTSSKATKRKV